MSFNKSYDRGYINGYLDKQAEIDEELLNPINENDVLGLIDNYNMVLNNEPSNYNNKT